MIPSLYNPQLKISMADLPNYMQRRGPYDLPPELTYECRHGCGAAFSSETSLKMHEGHHNRQEIRCPYYVECKYSTFNKNGLQDHVESFHYGVNRHQCPSCDFTGPSLISLTKHRKSEHGIIPTATQAKDYMSPNKSPKKPISASKPGPSRSPYPSPHPSPSRNRSDRGPSMLDAVPSSRMTEVFHFPPPIRALEDDIVNWPVSPPRK